ncbi:MAG: O-antigen ligase family protein [Lachnospiraceae bacterium]|nr:O-antigen ligase family protein [Lachnospiraceae bacterium]
MLQRKLSKLNYAFMLLLLVGLFLVVPLYFTDGYAQIGEDKYNCFRAVVLSVLAVWLPFLLAWGVVSLVNSKNRKKIATTWHQISETDCFVFLFLLLNVINFTLSDDKQTLWRGEEGWYMGLAMQLILTAFYILVSRFWNKGIRSIWMLYLLMIISAGIFLLGTLNRFSIRPVEMTGASWGYISTLGNINWYCGFWTVVFPIGLYFFFTEENRKKSIIWYGYIIIGLLAGITQGSQSGILAFVGMFLMLFFLSFENKKKMERFWIVMTTFFGCCQVVRVIRNVFPDTYNLDDPTYYNIFHGRLTLTAFLISVVILIIFHLLVMRKNGPYQSFKPDKWKWLRNIIVGMTLLLLAAGFLILLIRVDHPEILSFLNGKEGTVLDDNWGSGRGSIWRETITMFHEMSFRNRIIGVGPDGYAGYMYGHYAGVGTIINRFGDLRLTNAHCEILTVLINQGLLGLFFYIGIWVSSIIRALQVIKENTEKTTFMAGIAILSMVAYFANNLVSFAQVLNIPYLFILLGIAEAYIRRSKNKLAKPENP